MPGKGRKYMNKNATTYRLVRKMDPDGNSAGNILVPVNQDNREKFNMNLPSCLLPAPEISQLKEQIPVKGPHARWDPDILAALNDDFFPDDASVLEDNFVEQANARFGESQASEESENGSENGDGFLFSGSALSSAVTNCTEDMKLLNEKFERLYETYEEDAMYFDSIDDDTVSNDVINVEAADFLEEKKKLFPYQDQLEKDLKWKTLLSVQTEDEEESADEEVVTEQPLKYDCNSIISTYSNTQNRPSVIKVEKKVQGKILKKPLTKTLLRKLDREAACAKDEPSTFIPDQRSCIRPKQETQEEKRQRKQAIKAIRRESRMMKKQNKLLFTEEKERMKSVKLNASRTRHTLLF